MGEVFHGRGTGIRKFEGMTSAWFKYKGGETSGIRTNRWPLRRWGRALTEKGVTGRKGEARELRSPGVIRGERSIDAVEKKPAGETKKTEIRQSRRGSSCYRKLGIRTQRTGDTNKACEQSQCRDGPRCLISGHIASMTRLKKIAMLGGGGV